MAMELLVTVDDDTREVLKTIVVCFDCIQEMNFK